MKIKKDSNFSPDSFESYYSPMKPPILRIDLKKLCSNINKNSTSFNPYCNCNPSLSEPASPILRPISNDAKSHTITYKYKNSNYSNLDSEVPIGSIQQVNNSINESNLTEVHLHTNNEYDCILKKFDKNHEEEEKEAKFIEKFKFYGEENETNEKSIEYLDSLITKIRKKGEKIRNDSEKSILFLREKIAALNSREKIEYGLNEDDLTLKEQCYRLNKYLEEKGVILDDQENTEIESDKIMKCDMKKSTYSSEVMMRSHINKFENSDHKLNQNNSTNNKTLKSEKPLNTSPSKNQNNRAMKRKSKNSPSKGQNNRIINKTSKNSPNNNQTKRVTNETLNNRPDEFHPYYWQNLSTPSQKLKVVSSSQGIFHKKITQSKNLKNMSISCQLDE